MLSLPCETIYDWSLVGHARGEIVDFNYQMLEEFIPSRGFTRLHKLLFKVDVEYSSIIDYLDSLTRDNVAKIIDSPDSYGRTALAWAVEFGLTESIRILLAHGANPNQLRCNRNGGFTPLLHLAIAGPCSAWMDADIVESVRLLVEAGANPNLTDHEGWTSLHIAASWSLFSITDVLQRFRTYPVDWLARTNEGESIFDVCDNIDYVNKYTAMVNTV